MSDLFNKLLGTSPKGSLQVSLDDSIYFNEKDIIPSALPILNIAFSGEVDGGFVSGLTILSGKSKSFKTLLGFLCMKAYQVKYPDATILFYDSEFGAPKKYLQSLELDTSRIIHIPTLHIEQLKFDLVDKLKNIKRGDKVFIFVDSLGNLASVKEVEDAEEQKSVADMSRAKAITSLFRIVTPHFTIKDLSGVIINHVYDAQDNSHSQVVGGGQKVMLSATSVFIITKSQIQDSNKTLIGWNYTINIEKSRYTKEKSKLSFSVLYNGGIDKYSGMLDLAVESGFAVKTGAWYQLVNPVTGEVIEKKTYASNIEKDWFRNLIKNETFKQYVRDKYMLAGNGLLSEDTLDDLSTVDQETD
jgi:RecA/RadA recombinase